MLGGGRRVRQLLLGVLIAVGMVLMHGLVGLDGAGCADDVVAVTAGVPASDLAVSGAAEVMAAGSTVLVAAADGNRPEPPGPCSDCLNHLLSACVAVLAALLIVGAAVSHFLVLPIGIAVVVIRAVIVTAARPPRTHAVHLASLCVSRT